MPVNILFAAPKQSWEKYQAPLRQAFKDHGIDANFHKEMAPHEVDYIIYAPSSTLQDFSPFTRAKAVMNLWAGVESVAGNPSLTQPLCRMVDFGLTQGMTEWVLGHVLRYHLGMDAHIFGQDGIWRPKTPPLAQARPVTILGLGHLGLAAGQALARLGFPVTGWSRTPKEVPGIRTRHGQEGLRAALEIAQICVLLLPSTKATENVLNAESLRLLPRGSYVINPGRGPLIDDDALLAALDRGHIAHATLDVFRTEPLPQDHPYWAHPKVTVTPHIAAETRAETGANVIAQNIAEHEAGAPLRHLVNRESGY